MFRGRVSSSEKMFFTKHLMVMLKSGIPIADILETLTTQAKSGTFRNILQQVSDDVAKGQSFEKSLSKHPKVFDLFYLSLIRVGEESGTLEESMGYLAELLERESELRKKIQSAMLYPTLILSATGVIGLGLAFFVLPQITEMFEGLAVELPLTTKILISIAGITRDYGLIILPGLFLTLTAAGFVIRSRRVKPYFDALILKLPIFGYFMTSIIMSSLSRNLGIMLRSGLSITTALETVTTATQNAVYKRDLEEITEEVKKGKSIEKALQEGGHKEFPPFVSRMIGVGERSGNLEENLIYLGEYFETEVDTIAKNMTTLLEPVLLIFIGLVVGFFALSVITPIYKLTGSIR